MGSQGGIGVECMVFDELRLSIDEPFTDIGNRRAVYQHWNYWNVARKRLANLNAHEIHRLGHFYRRMTIGGSVWCLGHWQRASSRCRATTDARQQLLLRVRLARISACTRRTVYHLFPTVGASRTPSAA